MLAGTVVMLPHELHSNSYDSVFYITMMEQTIHEGEVIGHVEKGFDELCKVIREVGCQNGTLKKRIIVHDCGRI